MSSMSERTELRGQCATPVVQALDALAMTMGLDRTAYVNQVLEAHVKAELHKASLLTRALRGNPLLSDAVGGTDQ